MDCQNGNIMLNRDNTDKYTIPTKYVVLSRHAFVLRFVLCVDFLNYAGGDFGVLRVVVAGSDYISI